MSNRYDMQPEDVDTVNLEILIAVQGEILRCRVLISEIQDPSIAARYRRQIDELEQVLRLADGL